MHVNLQALLIDRSKFRATVFFNGVLVQFVSGKLTDDGSLDFLAKFLLGGPKYLYDYETRQDVIAPTPHVAYHESMVTSALKSLAQHVEYDLSNVSFLGMGATGVVLEMSKRTKGDGSDGGKMHTRYSVSRCGIRTLGLFVFLT